MRMTPERFDHLLSCVSPYMKARFCRSREVISHEERLAITLRYLATGKLEHDAFDVFVFYIYVFHCCLTDYNRQISAIHCYTLKNMLTLSYSINCVKDN